MGTAGEGDSVFGGQAWTARIARSGRPTGDETEIRGSGTIEGPAALSAGHGRWNETTNRYEINGRTYAVEPTGTVFPDSGPGFLKLSRSEYKVLRQLVGSVGDVKAAREALRRDPGISESDWPAALEAFRHHKSYKGEA